ncbi:sensor histidine kinase [Roseburia sp. 499]|uniref:sensor histidine kinase n=1 Tax=Roseburia sp. 499 TaxID=1261634 RepID=UPI000952CC97|nr:HAMP domain-containing sensor histidine kinase [Roseburia sp. 499]WVK70130.1 HAMP domain-containing sensor histidine kinase [Roseburia sp. 499]
MKRTLYLKLLLGYVAFGILGFITIATFTSHQTMDYIENEAAENLYRESNLIASNYAADYYRQTMTLDDLKSQISAIAAYLDADIWIVDTKGTILIDSANTTPPGTLIKNFDITSFGAKYSLVGTFYDIYLDDVLTVFSPITINYKVKGYVMIHQPLTQLTSFNNGFLNISYMTLAIIFLCAFVVLGLFTYTVYIPIRKITKAAKEYATGDFTQQINIHTNDEIGYLAASLNFMATELSTLEEDQRKFIANVSHDFRSPLTSIKGYIEAIMDGTIPYEMQDKYLNIILFETERLNKLTQSMLELNKYGKKGTMLDISRFDINNTIKMVVQSFEGTCKQKKISFELILTGQTLFVSADMSRIQQVLYNLIDNAIKFSHADSTITIETTEKNEKVFVSVKDTGIGIPKDSLKKIWERFYKTDLSRGKDKRGTGLGLAIVKEIISAHDENINVISTEGVGTEFIFTLPLA